EAVPVSARLIRDVGKSITQSPISSYQLEYVSISFSQKQITKDSTGDFCSMFDAVEASIWPDRTRAIDSCSYTPVLGPAIAKGLVEASNAEVVKVIEDAKARLPDDLTKWVKSKKFEHGDNTFALPLTYTTVHFRIGTSN
ncbi:hypothetical protein IFM89_004426, partial [Coptis chinensis]